MKTLFIVFVLAFTLAIALSVTMKYFGSDTVLTNMRLTQIEASASN